MRLEVLEHDIGAASRARLAAHDLDLGASADQGPLPVVPERPRATDANRDVLEDPAIVRWDRRDDGAEFLGHAAGQEVRRLGHDCAL